MEITCSYTSHVISKDVSNKYFTSVFHNDLVCLLLLFCFQMKMNA